MGFPSISSALSKNAWLCAVCADVPRVPMGHGCRLMAFQSGYPDTGHHGAHVYDLWKTSISCLTWPINGPHFFQPWCWGQNFLWDWRIRPVSLGDSASLLPSTYGMYASAVWHNSTVAVIGWATLHMTCRQHLPRSYAHPWKITALKNGDRNPSANKCFVAGTFKIPGNTSTSA